VTKPTSKQTYLDLKLVCICSNALNAKSTTKQIATIVCSENIGLTMTGIAKSLRSSGKSGPI